jgi:hypothetical protein
LNGLYFPRRVNAESNKEDLPLVCPHDLEFRAAGCARQGSGNFVSPGGQRVRELFSSGDIHRQRQHQ